MFILLFLFLLLLLLLNHYLRGVSIELWSPCVPVCPTSSTLEEEEDLSA